MKTNRRIKIVGSLAALALSCFLNQNLSAANAAAKSNGADDPTGHDAGDDNGGDRPGHHLGETNEIEGHEVFHGHIMLVPTTNSPAGVRGSAELEQEDEEGTVFYKVQVRVSGLDAGTYPVTAVLISDGSTVSLGDLTVSNSGDTSRADLLLPAGVDITDLGQIVVSDSLANALLVGDVNGAAPGTMTNFRANIRITPGPGAPNAKGRASLNLNQRRGHRVEHFSLMANKLPANTTFNIIVDGSQHGTVTSRKNGQVVLRSLDGADLSSVRDISLVSASDATEALSVHF